MSAHSKDCALKNRALTRPEQPSSAGKWQPCSTFTQNVHCVPLVEVQILRLLGWVVMLSYYLVEDWTAPGSLWQKGGLQWWHERRDSPPPA